MSHRNNSALAIYGETQVLPQLARVTFTKCPSKNEWLRVAEHTRSHIIAEDRETTNRAQFISNRAFPNPNRRNLRIDCRVSLFHFAGKHMERSVQLSLRLLSR